MIESKAGTLIRIQKSVSLPGEGLREFRAMWVTLSTKDQNDLKEWMAAQDGPSSNS